MNLHFRLAAIAAAILSTSLAYPADRWETHASITSGSTAQAANGESQLERLAALSESLRFGAGSTSDLVIFGVPDRGIFIACDENGDGVADLVKFFLRESQIMPSDIASLADPSKTVFVNDVRGRLYKFTQTEGAGIPDPGYNFYYVKNSDGLLAFSPVSVWLGSMDFGVILQYSITGIESGAGMISLPNANLLPGYGESLVSMAQGRDGSVYLLDAKRGSVSRIRNLPFGGFDWGRLEEFPNKYPGAVKITTDEAGKLYMLVSGNFGSPVPSMPPVTPTQPMPYVEAGRAMNSGVLLTDPSAYIVVFRDNGPFLPTEERQIRIGLGPFTVPYGPYNGIAVRNRKLYVISNAFDQYGPRGEIRMVNLDSGLTTFFLHRDDIGSNTLSGLAVLQ